MKRSLIFFGGWDGHKPVETTAILAEMLKQDGFTVETTNSLARLDAGDLATFDLITPNWTMGEISPTQSKALRDAVEAGTGLAGLHGGMCDAFRKDSDYQFMTGGQFVAHPGNLQPYTVRPTYIKHPITAGIPEFSVTTEQYYMHTDPANTVLMSTTAAPIDNPNGPAKHVEMPVVWIKKWGRGKVFYSALGHSPDIVSLQPHLEIVRRGFIWAAR